ncbi:MAG: hypothetical protein D6801_01915 [Alphaproteobacteria bacterium]|nr:MAG: hypothetical protein D6801_01915 [Alphaproteobacteria bacterium]
MSRLAGALFVGALAIGGCAPAPPADTQVAFRPDAGGLAVLPDWQRIDFGRAPSGVIAALDRVLGPGRDLGRAGCPASVARQISWGGLVLAFSDERFIGWREQGAASGTVCKAEISH